MSFKEGIIRIKTTEPIEEVEQDSHTVTTYNSFLHSYKTYKKLPMS